MKIELWMTGKTAFPYLEKGIDLYLKRLKRYLPVKTVVLPDIKYAKNRTADQLKQVESQQVLDRLEKGYWVILLDEKGKEYTSEAFARKMEQSLQLSSRKIIFVIGGAYGFSEALYARADQKIALSKMTFSHQMVRLFFVEQLYRAMTILRGEPYHHS